MTRQYRAQKFKSLQEKQISSYLTTHWNDFFSETVKLPHDRHNIYPLTNRIHSILGASDEKMCSRYIRHLQTTLKDIDADLADPNLRVHWGIDPDQQVKEIHFHHDLREDKVGFLIRFEDGTSLVCFPPEFDAISPVLYDKTQKMTRLPPDYDQEPYEAASGNQYCKAFSIEELQLYVSTRVNATIPSEIQGVVIDREALKRKVFSILIDQTQPLDQKKTIIKNVIENYRDYILEVISHIQTDLKEDDESMNHKFGLSPDYKIAAIKFLGDETHKKGKVPLLITFSNGSQREIQLVYKPRSMIAEDVLYSQNGSLFQAAGLPTYHIHDKGSHGYAEFLVNTKEDNTFDSEEELLRYLAAFKDIDQVLQPLNAQDLHGENIITRSKEAHVIDGEVILGPQDPRPSQNVMDPSNKTMWCFDLTRGNRIWLTPALAQRLKLPTFEEAEMGEALCLYKYLEQLPESRFLESHPNLEDKIAQVKDILSQHAHRYVPIATADLVYLIKIDIDEGCEQFIKRLKDTFAGDKLEFITEVEPAIRARFKTDVMNNDVPFCYYLPSRGECFYGDLLIGRKM